MYELAHDILFALSAAILAVVVIYFAVGYVRRSPVDDALSRRKRDK